MCGENGWGMKLGPSPIFNRFFSFRSLSSQTADWVRLERGAAGSQWQGRGKNFHRKGNYLQTHLYSIYTYIVYTIHMYNEKLRTHMIYICVL